MNSKVLVTGGCGYIGSHMMVDLYQAGVEVVCLDDLSNSHQTALQRVEAIVGKSIPFTKTNLCDIGQLESELRRLGPFEAVFHFAAYKAVEESVKNPLKYYHNNLQGLVNLIAVCEKLNIPKFIFSSSCTVYGAPATMPVTEDTPPGPIGSPYGWTKYLGEQILRDAVIANPKLQVTLLRYFNPAGAHPSGLLGEDPIVASSNLVPAICETALGERNELQVFGDTYDTRDGSCIRDYIHICDLTSAHLLAWQWLNAGGAHERLSIFNLGIGNGVTVLEAVHAFERVTGKKLPYRISPPRSGDVPAIWSSYEKASRVLGWKPKYSVDDIMRTAWAWALKRNN